MTAGSSGWSAPETKKVLRPAAEERWADELTALAAADAQRGAEIPQGWRLSPHSVRAFIVGDEDLGIARKFYGDDPLVDRAIVTLLGRQGLMLVGEPGNDLRELKSLVDTLGMETVSAITLSRLEVQPAYGMGKGKAEEIASNAKECESDCIVFDFTLEPTKQRNWEKLSGLPSFDREEVILRIFASRAQTHEAVLQVELARLEYSLPRLHSPFCR